MRCRGENRSDSGSIPVASRHVSNSHGVVPDFNSGSHGAVVHDL